MKNIVSVKNLYDIMSNKGWYPTSDAEAVEVHKVKDKFKPL